MRVPERSKKVGRPVSFSSVRMKSLVTSFWFETIRESSEGKRSF